MVKAKKKKIAMKKKAKKYTPTVHKIMKKQHDTS